MLNPNRPLSSSECPAHLAQQQEDWRTDRLDAAGWQISRCAHFAENCAAYEIQLKYAPTSPVDSAMSIEQPRRAPSRATGLRESHWSGLSKRVRRITILVLAATLTADLILLTLDYQEHGLRGIAGGYYAVDLWDVAKTFVAGAALLIVAQSGRSRAILVLAVVFVLVGIEDLITLHGYFASALRTVSGGLVPKKVGELIAFIGFGVLVLILVWVGTHLETGNSVGPASF